MIKYRKGRAPDSFVHAHSSVIVMGIVWSWAMKTIQQSTTYCNALSLCVVRIAICSLTSPGIYLFGCLLARRCSICVPGWLTVFHLRRVWIWTEKVRIPKDAIDAIVHDVNTLTYHHNENNRAFKKDRMECIFAQEAKWTIINGCVLAVPVMSSHLIQKPNNDPIKWQ